LKTDCVRTLRLSIKDVPERVKEEKLKKRRSGSSTFRTIVRSEVERQKRSDNDFNLPWRGNNNEANEIEIGKAKACISSRLRRKHDWS